MRILALDHGTKRIGVAVSDELKMLAQPLDFIPAERSADVLLKLKELLETKQVELILVGMPRNMDGSYGPAAEKVREYLATNPGDLVRDEAISRHIREIVENHDLPERMKIDVSREYQKLCNMVGIPDLPVAVRSSGAVSMPGQMESFLNVRGRILTVVDLSVWRIPGWLI